MPVLTAKDLRQRVATRPVRYQFESADNLHDVNFVIVQVSLSSRSGRMQTLETRVLTWELDALALSLQWMADGKLSELHPRFLDSGLHLSVRRNPESGQELDVAVIMADPPGPLPADTFQRVEVARRLGKPKPSHVKLVGLKLVCSRGAVELFATELREALESFPVRRDVRPQRKALRVG